MLRDLRVELGDVLERVVAILPSAWQFPDLAYASITLKSRHYQTPGFEQTKRRQQADITIEGERVGLLELGYGEGLSNGEEPEFLPEEQTLLTVIAVRLAEIVALKESQSRLATYQENLQSLAAELTLAEERERRSLALNLHDRIGQGLAVAKLKLESLKHLLPEEHSADLEDVSDLIKQIIGETRSLTSEISPPILYELGLQQAIVWLGERVSRQYGLPVEVRCDERLPELTEGVRIMLFRSIQELLVNSAKHARASHATVSLSGDTRAVRALVADDGVGFAATASSRHPSIASGFGLFSIRERIGHLGGLMEIRSAPGKGTRVLLTVPGSEAIDTG